MKGSCLLACPFLLYAPEWPAQALPTVGETLAYQSVIKKVPTGFLTELQTLFSVESSFADVSSLYVVNKDHHQHPWHFVKFKNTRKEIKPKEARKHTNTQTKKDLPKSFSESQWCIWNPTCGRKWLCLDKGCLFCGVFHASLEHPGYKMVRMLMERS